MEVLDPRYHTRLSFPSCLSTLRGVSSTTHLALRLFPFTKISGRRFLLRIRCSDRRTDSYWESNAEEIGASGFWFREETFDEDEGMDEEDGDVFGRRGNRKWWSDDPSEYEEDSDFFEESVWDKFSIFKALKSFGWMLPPIIISMLLTSGPKAFLMALALPLGQSAISLVFDKVWGKSSSSKPRSKARRRPFTRNFREEEEDEEEEIKYDTGGRPAYKSWVATEGGVAEKESSQSSPSLGGWEELENTQTSRKEAKKRTTRTIGGSSPPRAAPKTRLSRRGRYRDVPLFLRLLIAVFPFLGSWTKIL
ncbi:hypothetical protein H6P81_012927 [Aristolochia fimbriata]|uniref:Uncharacterized protein n=1 Tax=Aristolochia fimbriata TaxID=158543 RepID=A0AAV7EET0_ARIFI|nr:hypothetical protein H6P81_012927 [Aristolochia fimbriata]